MWCAEYKGEFMLVNRQYCYPLTVTDFASRYLLSCEALSTTQEKFAFTVFERTFKENSACRALPMCPEWTENKWRARQELNLRPSA